MTQNLNFSDILVAVIRLFSKEWTLWTLDETRFKLLVLCWSSFTQKSLFSMFTRIKCCITLTVEDL